MTKKFCPSRLISQEPCIIWLSFMGHMCKMIMSVGVFLILSKLLIFLVVTGWKGKKWSKMTYNSVCHAWYLRDHTSYDCHLCYTCVKWYLWAVFSFFQNFDFFWVVKEVKGQKTVQMTKNCVVFHIEGSIHHVTVIYGTHL